jgi:hypothetical protein
MNLPIFPLVLALLDACAAGEAALRHQWLGVVYWLAAAVLTLSVTVMQAGGAR